jgi:predicted permease
MLSDLRFRFRALFRRHAMETDLEQELRFHFENEVEKHERAGLTHQEAMRRARLAFGGHDQIKEDAREARGTSLLESCIQDIRYGLRGLCKNPSFFMTAALTLALGIGATTAVFSLVDTILLKPLPYPNTGRVAMLWNLAPAGSFFGADSLPWWSQEFQLLTEKSTVFRNLGAFKKDSFNLTGSANPELLDGIAVSAGFFPTMGTSPRLGRTFTMEEDRPGHEHVAVLSNSLWQSRFGGDARIVGRVIELNGYPYTVIGVMPASFIFPNPEGMPPILGLPQEPQLWVPLALSVAPTGEGELGVIGELKPGVSIARAQQDMNVVQRRLEERFPEDKGWSLRVVPLTRQTMTGSQRPLLLLLGAVSVVLLIACSNVAGLMLNRSLVRRREFTLRGALGAKRGRLIRQLMTESLLLALTGGLMGILLGEVGLYGVRLFGPNTIPHLQETVLDLRVIAFATAITLITGVLFGLVPAFGATRLDMVEVLKGGDQRSGGSIIAPRIRNALLTAQVALGLVLAIAAGLLLRSFYQMIRTDPGFDATRVVTFELPLPSSKYNDMSRIAQLYQQVHMRLQCLPGIQSAGFASVVPMGGGTEAALIRIPGHPVAHDAERPAANYSIVSPGYFATLGTALRRGRDFSVADTLDTIPVTIINRAMAKKYWPGEDPIGKQIAIELPGVPVRTIVGLVDDIKQVSLREEPGPEMFVPYTQNKSLEESPSIQSLHYVVRTKGDPASITESVRQAVHAEDPDLPIARFAMLATLVDASTVTDRFSMLLLAAFGVLALLLASIGMYGVISYSVMQRTPEIGIRIALGAGRGQILLLVLKQGSLVVCSGIVIGLIAAFTTTRLMTRFLYGVQATDTVTFAAVSFLQVVVALLACTVPARKAMKVDPMIALRYE